MVYKNFRINLLFSFSLYVFNYVFICEFIFASASQAQSALWSEGEHLEIGIDASIQACASLRVTAENCPNQGLFRKDKKISFQYGELLAAADYYMNPNDFYNDTQTNLAKIIKCAYRQKRYHEAQKKENVPYPNCTLTGLFSMPGYLDVVSHNYNHFGWNNMLSYVEYHGQALKIAKLSFETKTSNPQLSKQLLHKAIIFNSFADHYLSDAFASGHIRVPRLQIKNWARKQLPGLMKSSRGDLLSMILHNFESVNPRTGIEMGLRVQNSLGNVWLTRSDERLNLFSHKKDLTVLLPKKAVEESFKDILIAAEYGEIPEGVYRAAQLVPFQLDMPLIDKLSPEHQQVKRQSEVVSLFFLSTPMFQRFFFYKSDFAKMLDALSNIFFEFRQDIANDQFINPELKQRLPEKYLHAYLNVE